MRNIIGTATIVVGALSCLTSAAHAQAEKEWLIAEVAATTGPASTVGTRLSRSVNLWAEEVNAAGGIKGRKVRIVTCNDEGRPDKAVACTRDALRDGAVLIFAHSLTASIRAMQPLVKDGPVTIVASPNVVPEPNTMVFQTSPSDENIMEGFAKFLKANEISELGMIAATDASGEVGVISANKVFPAGGIKLSLARIDLKATDASTQIATVVSPTTKVLYSNYSGAGAATVVKSFTNLGLKVPLVVSYANLSEAFTQVVKDFLPPRLLATGLNALVPSSIEDKATRERTEAFFAAYQKKYNERADMINVNGKFSADVADAILRNVNDPSDAKAVKTFLETTPIASVHPIRFTADRHVGLDAKDVKIVELKGGAWVNPDPVK